MTRTLRSVLGIAIGLLAFTLAVHTQVPPGPGGPVENGGAIAGTVLGAQGDALPGVEMLALRRSLIGGRWILTPGPTTTTDDLGHYRFGGLAAGDYVVAARPDQDPETPLLLAILSMNPAQAADVLAAATAESRARPEPDVRMKAYGVSVYPEQIHTEPGSERLETDFALKLSKVVRVSGRLAERVDGITLQMYSVDAAGIPVPIESGLTACDEEGAFEFTGVAPGRYLIKVVDTPATVSRVTDPLPATPAYSGSTRVNVSTSGLTNVIVPVHKGIVLSGRAVFSGTSPRPPVRSPNALPLWLEPLDRMVPRFTWRAEISPDGQFRTMSLPPGEYLLRAIGATPGWTVESAISGGHDMFDVPVVVGANDINDVTVTLTDTPHGSVGGTVRAAHGDGMADASVILFPVDRTLWRDSSPQARRLRLMRSGPSGRFDIPNLPSGEYFAIAVRGSLTAEWQDPDALAARAAVATRVHVRSGSATPVDLDVKPDPAPRTRRARPEGRSSGLPAPAARQPTRASKGTAATAHGLTVSGTVIDQRTGKAAANATVLIAGTDVGVLHVTSSDERGHFLLNGLPAGHFLLGASKPGYLPTVHGASRPGRPGLLLSLESGQPPATLTLPLIKGGVISGQVTGDDGRRAAGVRMRVVQHRTAGGEISMVGDAGEPVNALTDDRGRYRIFNLPPGEYAVIAQGRLLGIGATSMAGWMPAYAPGTASATDALAVTLAAGEVRSGIDVRTKTASLVRVTGLVTSRDPASLNNVQVALRPRGFASSGAVLANFQTRPGPDGRFTFANVPPGEYSVLARTLPPPPRDQPLPGQPPFGPPVQWAMTDVTVRGMNINGVELALQPGLRVTGELVMDNGAPLPADLPIIRVGVRPTPGSFVQNVPPPVPATRDGRFVIDGLMPGRYRIFVQIPNNNVLQVPAWFAKTATPSGANIGDALDVPFDVMPGGEPQIFVTLTDTTPEIDGVVRNASDALQRDCSVVVFATDPAYWFQQSRRVVIRQTGRDGRFVFGIAAGLPAGDYYVAAVPDGRPGELLDVTLLEELAKSATRVTLNADETKTVELVLRRPGL